MEFTEQPEVRVQMKAFATAPPTAGNEWPDAWGLVEVGPPRWMCTLPVHELVGLVRGGVPDVDLRRLPYQWLGADLVIQFGPACVIGSADDWLSLCRRLLDSAESTEGVYELPGTQPWSGPTLEVAVRSIAVGDSEEPEHRSPVAQLAAAGGFDEREFVELFGADWAPSAKAHNQDEISILDERLFLWGTPPQLGAVVAHDGNYLEIGIPRGSWPGPGELRYRIDDPTPISREVPDEEIRDAVQDHLRRRRRSFGWCRYCGERVAPEQRFEPGVCYGCASTWFGVVY